jgi:prepilin-type N-terminal cleavage/methylation domain-containing protein
MRRLRAAARRRDAGVTLIELMVVMLLLSVLGTVILTATQGYHRVFRATDDQSQGLADVRVASERLDRDIRDARSVLCNPPGTNAALAAADATCAYHLQLWIDYNSDYKLDPSGGETVTWWLQPIAGGHYNVLRQVGTNTAVVEARTVVQQIAFSYDYPPGPTEPGASAAHTTTVNLNMTYDAVSGSGTTTKTVTETARLRNVA